MSTYRLDYIATDLAAGVEILADCAQFESADDTAATREAKNLLASWGTCAGQRRTGRLWAVRGYDKRFVGNV